MRINNDSIINLGNDRPILSNYLSKNKIYLSKELLATLILSSHNSCDMNIEEKSNHMNNISEKLIQFGLVNDDNNDHNTNEDIKKGILHWQKRNWTNSLSYYLWSHTGHLADRGDDYLVNQYAAIDEYIKQDGLPKKPLTASANSISLEAMAPLPDKSVGDILWEREALLATPRRSVLMTQLSSILWYGMQNLRHYRQLKVEDDHLNAIHSFGAAFDIYLCAYSVDSIHSGIYFYDCVNHSVDLIKKIESKELRQKMYKAQFDQKIASTASFAVLLVADFERYQWRYRHEAALRQIYINCGQIIHPLMLCATLYDYKTGISPAIHDSLALDLLGLDKKEFQVIYILSVG